MSKQQQNFSQIMEVMDTNALVLKHNVIDIIVNVIVQDYFALIAIAKTVKTCHLLITYRIDIQL